MKENEEQVQNLHLKAKRSAQVKETDSEKKISDETINYLTFHGFNYTEIKDEIGLPKALRYHTNNLKDLLNLFSVSPVKTETIFSHVGQINTKLRSLDKQTRRDLSKLSVNRKVTTGITDEEIWEKVAPKLKKYNKFNL